eukprot:Rmarinus@m.4907
MPAGNISDPDYEGYLKKLGEAHQTWKKRWFVLKGNTLYYFKQKDDGKWQGLIDLNGMEVRECTPPDSKSLFSQEGKRRYTIGIFPITSNVGSAKLRVYYLSCESEVEMDGWLHAVHLTGAAAEPEDAEADSLGELDSFADADTPPSRTGSTTATRASTHRRPSARNSPPPETTSAACTAPAAASSAATTTATAAPAAPKRALSRGPSFLNSMTPAPANGGSNPALVRKMQEAHSSEMERKVTAQWEKKLEEMEKACAAREKEMKLECERKLKQMDDLIAGRVRQEQEKGERLLNDEVEKNRKLSDNLIDTKKRLAIMVREYKILKGQMEAVQNKCTHLASENQRLRMTF